MLTHRLLLRFVSLSGLTLTLNTASAEEAELFGSVQAEKVVVSRHACMLSTNGQIKCWGDNSQGQLGVGTTINHGSVESTMGSNLPFVKLGSNVVAKDVCVGQAFTCAATTKGQVKCWGSNGSGNLGQERSNFSVGRAETEMGDNLPYTKLGDDFVAKNVECAGAFACALSEAGKVKCWGDMRQGGLGYTLPNMTTRGSKVGDMGNDLPYLPIPTPITHLTLGSNHACAVSNHKIYCWGLNQNGETGIESSASTVLFPTTPETPIPTVQLEPSTVDVTIENVEAGDGYTCATYFVPPGDSSFIPRKFKCWGNNSSGQFGIGSTSSYGRTRGSMGSGLPSIDVALNEIVEFHPYSTHTCAKNADGTFKCWGRNTSGQLGLGDRLNRGNTSQSIGKNLPYVNVDLPIASLSSGAFAQSTCAILINHEVKCWGINSQGVLGYEDLKIRGALPTDMGENLPYVRFN